MLIIYLQLVGSSLTLKNNSLCFDVASGELSTTKVTEKLIYKIEVHVASPRLRKAFFAVQLLRLELHYLTRSPVRSRCW